MTIIIEPAKSNHLQGATTFGISPGWLIFTGWTVVKIKDLSGFEIDLECSIKGTVIKDEDVQKTSTSKDYIQVYIQIKNLFF